MDFTPWILGACAAAVAGAVGGTVIETDPILNRDDIIAELPSHDGPAMIDRSASTKSLPNHYALETPKGRIEVAELSSHGLYRNKRFARSHYVEPKSVEYLDADYPTFDDTETERFAAATDAMAPRNDVAPKVVEVVVDAEPIASLAAAAPVELAGGPKTIDVAATLASR